MDGKLITNDSHTQGYYIGIVYGISILFWISTIFYRNSVQHGDLTELKTPLFTFTCDGWCVLHFVSYTLMGFLSPKYWFGLMVMGFVFELVEAIVATHVDYVNYQIVKDTIINSAGVVLGVFIRSVVTNKKLF